jgi:hypothetical protein
MCSFGISYANPVTINVTAYPLWTDTGISLTNGEWVNVNASGFWSFMTSDTNDPDGTEYQDWDLWVTNNIQGSLIAFVGDNP